MSVALPTYSGVQAGTSIDADTVYELEMVPSEVPSAFIVGGFEKIDSHLLIRVSGVSMAPRIHSGERVLIHKDHTPRPNTIVFAESPGGALFLKCLVFDGGRYVLTSYATEGISVQDLHGWRIHGYAIAIIGDGDGGRNIEWREGRPLRA